MRFSWWQPIKFIVKNCTVVWHLGWKYLGSLLFLFSNFELNSLALFDPSNCLRKIYSVAGECTRGIFNEVLWKIGIGSFLWCYRIRMVSFGEKIGLRKVGQHCRSKIIYSFQTKENLARSKPWIITRSWNGFFNFEKWNIESTKMLFRIIKFKIESYEFYNVFIEQWFNINI